MSKKFKKIIIIAVATSILVSTCVAPVYAAEQNSKKEYVLCKSNGEVKKFIVADENMEKLNYMDEDITYPLKTVVKYMLDNKNVSADELAGASGKIAIDIEYQGKEDNYKALTVILLDENHFSDIKVESGKIVSDGDKSIVVGITKVPGTLHIEADASEFEIKAMYAIATDSLAGDIDIEDFAPVFGIDISSIKDTINELKAVSSKSTNEDMSISEGISELTDGMDQLSEGLTTLDNNSAQLIGGAKQIFQSLIDMANKEIAASGADIPTLTISNYSKVLSNVISQASPEGVTKTARAAVESKVRENEPMIRAAVEQAVQAEVTRQVTEQVKQTIGVTDIEDGMLNNPMIQAKVTAAVQDQMASKVVKKTIDEKTNEKIASLIDENMNAPEVQSQIIAGIAKGNSGAMMLKELKTKLDSYNKFYIGLQQYTDGVSKAAAGATTINTATSEIAGSTKDLFKDDTLGLINDADELLEKAETKTDSIKYIIKFDSIKK